MLQQSDRTGTPAQGAAAKDIRVERRFEPGRGAKDMLRSLIRAHL